MITIEDKLEMFRKLLFENIQKVSLTEQDAVIKKLEEEKSELLKEQEQKEKQIIEDSIKKAEIRKRQIISEAQNNSYFKILKKKEDFINQIIVELKSTCEKFTDSMEYKNFLLSNIEKAFLSFESADKLYILLTEKDLNKFEENIKLHMNHLNSTKEIVFEKTEEDILGGFLIEDRNKNIQIDFSINSLIEENKGVIGSIIGQKLDGVIQ